jgi:general secretion pathway protein G
MSPEASPRPPTRRRRTALGDERGLTLVELLVVLIVIGLIAGFAVPRVMTFLSGARHDAAQIQIKRLGSVVELYALDVGQYPATSEGLLALVEAPQGSSLWAGPYLDSADALTDPWGNPYQYRSPGEQRDFDLWSLGADGKPGGERDAEDITNW